MATILKAGNVASGAQITSDSTGILEIKTGTGAGTTAMTLGADQTVTFAAGTTVNSLTTSGAVSAGSLTVNSNNISAVNSLGFRNRIINGGMVIDQRNNGASVNVTGNVYTLDRWNGGGVNDGVLAFQRVADAPTGFVNSLIVTVSTADSSLGATQYARVGQIIEGFNVSDFAGGTANAATVTFSFWVKSSLTGTFGGYLSSGDESRVYVFQYTINAASTWEQKTVTVTLPSSGTWATNSDAGFRTFFSLGAGSNSINTANTWLTSYAQQASGNVNVINTLSATWQITGVQLEAGSVATPFERRDYGRELIMCQRYFELMDYSDTGSGAVCNASLWTTSDFWGSVQYKTNKRATPTITYAGTVIGYAATAFSTATPTAQYITPTGFCLRAAVLTSQASAYIGNNSGFKINVASEL